MSNDSKKTDRAHRNPHQGSVLIVEDESELRFIIGAHLRAAGYEVLDAGDGAEAIGLAQEASLSIESPSPGSTVAGSEVAVKLRVHGAVLGERSRNGAQVLLHLDRYPPVKSYSESFTFRGVGAGAHRLVAELRHADGTPFEPAVRASVSFKVEPTNRQASRAGRGGLLAGRGGPLER